MKKARYILHTTNPQTGQKEAHYYKYSRTRSAIEETTHRLMDLLGHPCCGTGPLGKNHHIRNATRKATNAITNWERKANKLITTLPQAPTTPPAHKSK